ncbi:beta-lactamase family protein [Horticoccus luteus]|uniref:Beta-lactamase family protein n=1 Tax=Horticoccus luteus TaxID=2862869 RepID=A0A8F9TSQ9_9BACT|nr:serine hydrolase [Horticoccus luteus]QYM78361.1 beta-lactamase family protein [Horticoccus luteus]
MLTVSLAAQNPSNPAALDDGWTIAEPQAAGFDAAKLRGNFATMLSGEVNLHAVIVERHGRLVAEGYRTGRDKPQFTFLSRIVAFGPAVRHDTRSVGKSVIALLVGIAQAQGKLGPAGSAVLDFYPELADLATPALRKITVADLLTMGSGLAWRESGAGFPTDEDRLAWKKSQIRFVLGRPTVAEPSRRFNYNSGGTVVLADILERATHMPWTEFARTALFEPLGISDVEWVTDLRSRPMANSGLRLRPRDMAKLGRLVLNRGKWKERQVVPAAWIDEMLRPRLATGVEDTRYGYQWWTGSVNWQGRSLPWHAAWGNGSQRIFVIPDLDMTVVFTAGAYGDPQTVRQVQKYFQALVDSVAAQ